MGLEEFLKKVEFSQRPLVSDSHRTLTGQEFVDAVREVSMELGNMGIGGRKICMLRMVNNVNYVVTLFALLLCDSVVFLANPHDPVKKVSNTIDRFCPFALLTDKASSMALEKKRGDGVDGSSKVLDEMSIRVSLFTENALSIDAWDQRMEDADIAIFSSGSTGEPKAILHKLENLWLNARMHAESIGIRESDTLGVILPLYYSYGLVANLLAGFVARAHVNLHFQVGTVDSAWINSKNITVLSLTPYFTRTLIPPLPSLRILTVGGDILHRKQALSLMCRFPTCELFTTYGLTEAGPRVSTWRFDQAVLENSLSAPIGKPLDRVTLSFDENDQRTCSELVIHTPTRMVGYYYGGAQGFDPQTNAGAHIHTGDLVEVRNGECFLVGRKKHVITQGGEKLYPVVVENAIQAIEGVIDVRVEGVIDKEKGHVARAVVVAEEGVTAAIVKKTLLRSFPRSLVPERIEFARLIPRTSTGKAMSEIPAQQGVGIDGVFQNNRESNGRYEACSWSKFHKKEYHMANPADSSSLLVGAWDLKSYAVTTASGEALHLWGKDTSGLLIYLPSGYMSVHVSDRSRPKFRNNDIFSGTQEEIRAAFEGYTTYFGTYAYEPDAGVVYHHISESLFPNWSGVTQQRFTSLADDRLVLTTPAITINSAEYIMTLEWKRLNEERIVVSRPRKNSHG